MSDEPKPFRELHDQERWDAISAALFQVEMTGQDLSRVAGTARQLASKAGTWAFLTGDMEMTLDYGVSTGLTEREVRDRIRDLEAWTSDTDRWMGAYIKVLDELDKMAKVRQAFYDAMVGGKHE